MILTSDYYISKNKKRQEEYEYCINKVLENDMITKIVYFTQGEVKHKHEKITFVKTEKRPTYEDFFNYFNDNHKNEVIILSNLDIYFDDTLNLVNNIDMNNTILALTRYDLKNKEWVLYNENNVAQASQDTWIFKTPVDVYNMSCKFTLGIPGCDNRIAFEFKKLDYKVINNSLSIKTYHKHESNHRTWELEKIKPISGPYHYIKTTK